MEVELWNGQAKAIIDPLGAWVTNLSDDNGDILFPKRTLKVDGTAKLRGGAHICLPNFGPGGNSGQLQHGFGREMDWEVADKTDTSLLLKLDHGLGDYENLTTVLAYQLEEQGLIMTLEVTNDGEKDLRVAPGFHPYFATKDMPVKINGETQKLDELNEAQFVEEGATWRLEAAERTLTLNSQGLPAWAKWTDQLGPYVCVEPSVGGFTFLNDAPTEAEVLNPGQSETYVVTIRW